MRGVRLLIVVLLTFAAAAACAGDDAGVAPSQLAGPSLGPTRTAESAAAATPTAAAGPTATPRASATPVPSPTATPAPSPAPSPTETASPTPAPSPTATPAPSPTETASPTPAPSPTETASPTPASSETARPDRTVGPTTYEGEVLALRTEQGVMLTVRSDGPPYEVVTPCYELATVRNGLPIEGPVDVLIDPGHGGEETGAVGPNGLVEAHVNLRVAEALRERLAAAGYRVLLTRYSDHRMAIQARTELANALEPRIFVSIHHNGGFPEPVDRPGTEVFVQQDDPQARRLGGVLWEELQAEFADDPIAWVGTDALGVSWRSNGEGTDLYGVLRRTPDLVSVLTEAMYLTNGPEAALLARPETIAREADALARGIIRWFDTDDPGSGYIGGLVFRGELGTGGGTEGCIDLAYD